MIHDEITDVLLRARIPASTKGFIYIHDTIKTTTPEKPVISGLPGLSVTNALLFSLL